MSWKTEIFDYELRQIHSEKHRKLAEYLLEKVVPDHFFVIRPSSTGKYHPMCTHRRGGLVIHTKRLIFFALDLAEQYQLDNNSKDLLILAGLFHDIGKKMTYVSFDEYKQHPITGVEIIKVAEDECLEYIDRGDYKTMLDLIVYHQGVYSPEEALKDISTYAILELILYFSDGLSANKFIEVPMDNFEIKVPEDVKEA